MTKKVLNFLLILVVTSLIFEGIEHLLHEFWDIHLDHYLTFGGVGFVVLWGFKFHVFCCLIPAAITTLICIKTNKECCDHNHTEES